MAVTTYYTEDYEALFRTLFINNGKKVQTERDFHTGKINNLHYFELQSPLVDLDGLVWLLSKIVLEKNKALCTQKAMDTLYNAVFKKNWENIKQTVSEYLEDNSEMHLEGYALFMLKEYSQAVNALLYKAVLGSLIKC